MNKKKLEGEKHPQNVTIKQKKVRIIYKKNLSTILAFLQPIDCLVALIVNKVFCEIFKNDKIYKILQKINSQLKKEHNTFPLQLLLKQNATLLDLILSNIVDNEVIDKNAEIIFKFIGKHIQLRLFQPYFNEGTKLFD